MDQIMGKKIEVKGKLFRSRSLKSKRVIFSSLIGCVTATPLSILEPGRRFTTPTLITADSPQLKVRWA